MPSIFRALMCSTSAPGKLFSMPKSTPIFFIDFSPSGSQNWLSTRCNSLPIQLQVYARTWWGDQREVVFDADLSLAAGQSHESGLEPMRSIVATLRGAAALLDCFPRTALCLSWAI